MLDDHGHDRTVDRGVTEERLQRHKRRHKELPVPLAQLKLFPALAKVHRVELNEAAVPPARQRPDSPEDGTPSYARPRRRTGTSRSAAERSAQRANVGKSIVNNSNDYVARQSVKRAGSIRAVQRRKPVRQAEAGDRSGPSAYVYRDDSESKVVQRWRALQNERYKEDVAGGGDASSSRFYTPQAVVRGSPRRRHKEDKRPPFKPASKRAAREAISQTFRHDYNQGSRYSYERAEKQREAEERKKWIDPAGFRTALSAAGARALIENQRFIMAPEPDQRRSEVLTAKRKGARGAHADAGVVGEEEEAEEGEEEEGNGGLVYEWLWW